MLPAKKISNSNWRYLATGRAEFPETYLLSTPNQESIQINMNKWKGKVEIIIQTKFKSKYKSVISNGTVIDERDMLLQKSKYLDPFFTKYKEYIKSLPDYYALNIIKGNYEIFLDKTPKIHPAKIKRPLPKIKKIKNKDNLNREQLIGLKRSNNPKIKSPFQKIRTKTNNLSKKLLQLPHFLDVMDAALICGLASIVYQWNFNLLQTGIYTAIGGIFSGYYDILIRKKSPYLGKLLLFIMIGYYSFYLGFKYQ